MASELYLTAIKCSDRINFPILFNNGCHTNSNIEIWSFRCVGLPPTDKMGISGDGAPCSRIDATRTFCASL